MWVSVKWVRWIGVCFFGFAGKLKKILCCKMAYGFSQLWIPNFVVVMCCSNDVRFLPKWLTLTSLRILLDPILIYLSLSTSITRSWWCLWLVSHLQLTVTAIPDGRWWPSDTLCEQLIVRLRLHAIVMLCSNLVLCEISLQFSYMSVYVIGSKVG
jgi:hypothetical protein